MLTIAIDKKEVTNLKATDYTVIYGFEGGNRGRNVIKITISKFLYKVVCFIICEYRICYSKYIVV